MSEYDNGFASAQEAYENQEPEEIKHSPECPEHEDNYGLHLCGYVPNLAWIEFDEFKRTWDLCIKTPNYPSTRIDYCPWCGEELPNKPIWICTCKGKDEQEGQLRRARARGFDKD